jgi:hypothetical protein
MMQPIIRHGPNKSWPKKNRPFYASSLSRQISRLSFHLSHLGPITSFQQLSPACLALFTFVADVYVQLLTLSIYIYTACALYQGSNTRFPIPVRQTREKLWLSAARQADSFTGREDLEAAGFKQQQATGWGFP